MNRLKVSGPVVTLVAAAALGIGLFAVNVSKEAEPAAPTPVAAPSTSAVASTTPPATTSTPAPVQFPAQADYVAEIPTANATLVLQIAVDGGAATAYACDNIAIEEWLAGTASDGVVDLASDDQTSRLDGQLQGSTVVGTLAVGDKEWEFTAAQVEGETDVR